MISNHSYTSPSFRVDDSGSITGSHNFSPLPNQSSEQLNTRSQHRSQAQDGGLKDDLGSPRGDGGNDDRDSDGEDESDETDEYGVLAQALYLFSM